MQRDKYKYILRIPCGCTWTRLVDRANITPDTGVLGNILGVKRHKRLQTPSVLRPCMGGCVWGDELGRALSASVRAACDEDAIVVSWLATSTDRLHDALHKQCFLV